MSAYSLRALKSRAAKYFILTYCDSLLSVAAGVLYPLGMIGYRQPSPESGVINMYEKGPQRIRLEQCGQVWKWHFVSVVCSSLLLRTKVWSGEL